MLIAAGDTALLSRWHPTALAAVHLAVLGFITPVMAGALLQILPVVYGAALNNPLRISRVLAAGLFPGTLGLAAGFIVGHATLLGTSGILLAATLVYLVAALLPALWRQTDSRGSRAPLRLGILSLGATVLIGLALAASRAGWLDLPSRTHWVDTHLAWGLAGWFGLVLIGVGREMIPMFYLSPPFPARTTQWMALLIFGVLTASAFSASLSRDPALWPGAMSLGAISAFAFVSIYTLMRRQRKIIDATLGFWGLGLISVVLGMIAWLAGTQTPLLGVLFLAGAGMSFTNGTLYKIVPFLCWLHLRQRAVEIRKPGVRIPTMKSFISERMAVAQLALHAAALTLWAMHFISGTLSSRAGSLALAASNVLLLYNLARAYLIYRSQLKLVG